MRLVKQRVRAMQSILQTVQDVMGGNAALKIGLGLLVLLAGLGAELRNLFGPGGAIPGEMISRDASLSWTVLGGIYAIGVALIAVRMDLLYVRFLAFMLLLGMLGKVFLYDAATLGPARLVLSILAAAASLGVSYLLLRRKKALPA